MTEELFGFIFATIWTLFVLRVLIISWFFPRAYTRMEKRRKTFDKWRPSFINKWNDYFFSTAYFGPWFTRFAMIPFLIVGILVMIIAFQDLLY